MSRKVDDTLIGEQCPCWDGCLCCGEYGKNSPPPVAKKLMCCDKHGWPVEKIKGRPILNFFRLLIHARKIKYVEVAK